MKILQPADPTDAPAIAALRTSAAERLTREYGRGHWSRAATESAVVREIGTCRVFVARRRTAIIATLRLATKKPWAIDTTYFTPCTTPLYLHDMAVAPSAQRRGLGRRCVEDALKIARTSPSQAVRLDAYDAEAGAGPFYAKCGFREVARVSYRGTPLIYYEMLL